MVRVYGVMNGSGGDCAFFFSDHYEENFVRLSDEPRYQAAALIVACLSAPLPATATPP